MTQARTTLVSSAANTASSTTRGRFDNSTSQGYGFLTLKMTNGGTGPTVQCVARILIAHKDTSMPAAASEGTADTDWKKIIEFGNGTTASSVSPPFFWEFGPSVAYIEVEFTGNTGQSVTVEAHVTLYTP